MTVSGKPLFVLRLLQAMAIAGLLLYGLNTSAGLGGESQFWNDWVYNGIVVASAVFCLARAALIKAERVAWFFFGLALSAWAAGELHYTLVLQHLEEPPYPSLGDAFFLAFYPISYFALVLLVRNRVKSFHPSLYLDGLVAKLAIAAFGAAILFPPILDQTGGEPIQIATDLAYPLGDMLMLGFVMGVFAITGWRPGKAWAFIGAGFTIAAVADSVFLYETSLDIYTEGTLLDALWPAGTLLIGLAAWQQPPPERSWLRLDGWRMLFIPMTFALTALGLLIYDHFLAPLNDAALILATITMVAVLARTAMTFGENLRMLDRSRREATSDALTGLGNRRRLLTDLQDEVAHATADEPRVLALFDLDGFKRYNDTYGHPAGDALLARLGHNLEQVVGSRGCAYRLGGDEFCALLQTSAQDAETIVEAAVGALSEQGKGFMVGSSCGMAVIPHEATDPTSALQIADQRLYTHKRGNVRSSASLQTRDVLLQVLQERQPDLKHHVSDVATLAVSIGRKLRLNAEEIDEIARAAELHDVGKMAVPDAVLQKAGPLDEGEWNFIKQHTIVGERMLSAAPALVPVAKLVRSSHEHWDGSGYPDGLEGEEIPLGARIVAVCDAFHAMTSSRPYRSGISPGAALAELRRCAGSQFDPKVVNVFSYEITKAYAETGQDMEAPAPDRSVPTTSEAFSPGPEPEHADTVKYHTR
jgi:diguanylate cyclase (GGDEF)-like protein